MLFFSCKDNYKKVGSEKATLIYPQGVANNFVLTYTKAAKELQSEDSDLTKIIAILTSPVSEDFDNLKFPHRTFPNGLVVEFFDDNGQKSTVTADYGIVYSQTNLVDLQGNVIIETHDNKKLETPQLFWDRNSEWIFTQEAFTYTNPEDGSIMNGIGMDFDQDFNFLNAHKTTGLIAIQEE